MVLFSVWRWAGPQSAHRKEKQASELCALFLPLPNLRSWLGPGKEAVTPPVMHGGKVEVQLLPGS